MKNKRGGKRPGAGRPEEYKPRYAQDLKKYFNVPAWKMVTREVWKDDELQKVKAQEPSDLPTLAGFCCKIGVHRYTLLNWAEAHEEFREALKIAKEHQERILVANGLAGNYDKTFAIFTAKNLINWHDKQVVDHNVTVRITDEQKIKKLENLRRFALVADN